MHVGGKNSTKQSVACIRIAFHQSLEDKRRQEIGWQTKRKNQFWEEFCRGVKNSFVKWGEGVWSKLSRYLMINNSPTGKLGLRVAPNGPPIVPPNGPPISVTDWDRSWILSARNWGKTGEHVCEKFCNITGCARQLYIYHHLNHHDNEAWQWSKMFRKIMCWYWEVSEFMMSIEHEKCR